MMAGRPPPHERKGGSFVTVAVVFVAIGAGCGPSRDASSPPPAPPGASTANPGPSVTSSPVQPVPKPVPTGSSPGDPGTHFPGAHWAVRDLGVAVPDEWRTCSKAEECTLVTTTCCDACNGGKAVSVNNGHVRDVEAKYPRQCGNAGCTERGCFIRGNCQEGRCVLEWETGSP